MTDRLSSSGVAPSANSRDSVNWGVRVAASWSIRVLIILAAMYVLLRLISYFGIVTVPVGLALLGSALLSPLVGWLQRHHVPRAIATVVTIVGGLAAVAGVMTFVVEAFINGLPEMQDRITDSINQVQNWLINGPLHLSPQQITDAGDNLTNSLKDHSNEVTAGAISTAGTLTELITSGLLAIFTLIFFLYGGRSIWEFVIRAVPAGTRDAVDVAGHRGFASLVGYVRATVAVAAVDAIGIGIGLAVLQVPLALPLAALVFLGAFIPIIGAVLTGIVAVAVALVTKGFVVALIVLGVVLAVNQLESHVLQPLLLGRAVRLHPVAVVLAIAAGTVVGGIIGALLAVPTIALLNSATRSLFAVPAEVADANSVTGSDPDQAALNSDDDTDPDAPSSTNTPTAGEHWAD